MSTFITFLALNLVVAAAETPGKITKEVFTFGEQTVTYYRFVPTSVTAPASGGVVRNARLISRRHVGLLQGRNEERGHAGQCEPFRGSHRFRRQSPPQR
jgi:hypothetical protein